MRDHDTKGDGGLTVTVHDKGQTGEVLREIRSASRNSKYGDVFEAAMQLQPGESLDIQTDAPSKRVQNSLYSKFRRAGVSHFRIHVVGDRRIVVVRIDPAAKGKSFAL